MPLDVSGCLNDYEAHGIRFQYPDIWEIQEESDTDGDVVITVLTEGTCFWTIRVLNSRPSPLEIMNSCVAAFREEYEDLDEYSESGVLAGLPATIRLLEFSCLELINTVSLSCVRAGEFSLLVWWQGTDHELGEIRPVFEKISGSVRIARRQD